MTFEKLTVPDLRDEDAELAAKWLAGPGARPTTADRERVRRAVAEGLLPRRMVGQA